jgi:hypothetical protein
VVLVDALVLEPLPVVELVAVVDVGAGVCGVKDVAVIMMMFLQLGAKRQGFEHERLGRIHDLDIILVRT